MSGKKLDGKDEAEDYRPPQTTSVVEVVRGDECPGQPDGGVYLIDVPDLSSQVPAEAEGYGRAKRRRPDEFGRLSGEYVNAERTPDEMQRD